MNARIDQTNFDQLKDRGVSKWLTISGLLVMAIMYFLAFAPLGWAESGKVPDVMHPMMNPKTYTEHAQCENCGMNLNMWARTRYSFENSSGEGHACSLNCVADIAYRTGEQPTNVKAALYLEPEEMVAVDKASYVIGSSARGTMAMNSKIVFASQEAANAFALEYGGQVAGFDAALALATDELEMNRKNIAGNRSKSGKIKDPVATDSCLVCGMYPAKFPSHRAQILTKDKQTLHFCSNQCLITYLSEPKKFNTANEAMPMAIWTTVFPDGGYDYAGGLYYLVGSSQMGSMGPEAIPLRTKAAAEQMAAEKGGHIVMFDQLSPAVIRGK